MLLDQRPVGFHLKLVRLPSRIEEREVGEQSVQPLPSLGLGQLPRQFIHLARAQLQTLEILRQAQMRAAAILLRGKIELADRLTEIVVEKADQTRAADQRLLGGQVERRPVDARERIVSGSQQLQNLGLRESPSRRPKERHGVADESAMPGILVVLLIAFEDLLVELVYRPGLQVVVDALAETLVIAP